MASSSRVNEVESAAGFVLAGGQSSRMGTDKALAAFQGIPLIQRALSVLKAAGLTARIAGSRSALGDYAEEIADTWKDVGPLGGVHAGLSASQAEWSLFLPVDMPLMPPSLLACLVRRAGLTGAPVTTCRLNGRMEPFPVVLHRRVFPLLENRLRSGRTAGHAVWRTMSLVMNSQLDSPAVENLVQCGQVRHPNALPPAFWFRSANTPEELAVLNRISRLGDVHGPLARPRVI